MKIGRIVSLFLVHLFQDNCLFLSCRFSHAISSHATSEQRYGDGGGGGAGGRKTGTRQTNTNERWSEGGGRAGWEPTEEGRGAEGGSGPQELYSDSKDESWRSQDESGPEDLDWSTWEPEEPRHQGLRPPRPSSGRCGH